jgi:signal peptidase I
MNNPQSDEPQEEYKDKKSISEELNNLEVENNPTKDFMYFIFDLLKTGIVVFIIAFCLRYFAVQPFIVDGESMMPNYVNNEYLLAEKVSYLIGQPQRGDVVIFRYPGNPNVSYIKRIIGLPGETVEIGNNTVSIINSNHPDGVKINEPYIPSTTLTLPPTDSGSYKKTLGTDEYFVMGDNRQHSSDSREWGILPKANIIGRAWFTIVPADKFGVQKRVSYPELSLQNLLRGLALINTIR